MDSFRFRRGRGALWLATLAALALGLPLALAGCGGTHASTHRSARATTVGVDLNDLNGTSTAGAVVVARYSANVVRIAPPRSLRGAARETFRRGEAVAAQSGCLGCHLIGADGNNGPGPELTRIGARLSRVEITRALVHPVAPMPSFASLAEAKLRVLTAFLAELR